VLAKNPDRFHAAFNDFSSRAMLFSAVSVFMAVVVTIVTFKSRYG